MKLGPIPAGYQLHVKSWENDYDSVRTIVESGLSLDEVKFRVKLLKLFARNSKFNTGNVMAEYGYSEIDWGGLIAEFGKICSEHSAAFTAAFNIDFPFSDIDEEDQNEIIIEFSCRMMGCSECYVFRIFEDYAVYYVPAEIVQLNNAEVENG